MSGDVEIIVGDNNSTDNTEEICKDFCDRFSNFYYYKNASNISNENFPLVLSKGHGVLRKISNDTQRYLDDSLSEMCKIISKYEKEKPFLFFLNGLKKTKNDILETDFNGFLKSCSYFITYTVCFSMWGVDCEGLESDTSGVELSLWQTRKALELACDKNVVVVNKNLFSVQTVEKKNLDYGLFKVFYINYFKLLNPYISSGKISKKTKSFLEKDLLFGFFLNWVLAFELQKENYVVSEENLKSAVDKAYHNKPYFPRYKLIYLCKRFVNSHRNKKE